MHPGRGRKRNLPAMDSPPNLLWTIHLAATVAMAGAIWVVQLAIYPLFGQIGPQDFRAYHRHYTARIGGVVGPLMLAEAGTALAGWIAGWRGSGFAASLVLLAVSWVSTFTVQVPLHRKLAGGFEAADHRRLVVTNWVRTAAWTLRAALLLAVTR